MSLIEIVIFFFSLNTQGQQGAGLKYYWIRNNNFDFSLSNLVFYTIKNQDLTLSCRKHMQVKANNQWTELACKKVTEMIFRPFVRIDIYLYP